MKEFLRGIKDGAAIGIGYLSVSFTFGLTAVAAGLTWWEAILISMTNLTSAGQFAGITIMASAGTYMEMALSQLVINLRYALMSISLSQKTDRHFRLPQKLLLGFANTDEIFAAAMCREGEVSARYFAGLAVLPYVGWTLGTLLGGVCGNILPQSVSDALGLAIYGMFIAIIVPAMKGDRNIFFIVLLAIVLSCCLYYIPVFQHISSGFSIIICAVIASAVGAVCYPVEEREEKTE